MTQSFKDDLLHGSKSNSSPSQATHIIVNDFISSLPWTACRVSHKHFWKRKTYFRNFIYEALELRACCVWIDILCWYRQYLSWILIENAYIWALVTRPDGLVSTVRISRDFASCGEFSHWRCLRDTRIFHWKFLRAYYVSIDVSFTSSGELISLHLCGG